MDVSAKALGYILLEKHKIKTSFHPVAYFSLKLNNARLNYCATKRKMLAIVKTLKYFYLYLHSTKFIIHTDHNHCCTFFHSLICYHDNYAGLTY